MFLVLNVLVFFIYLKFGNLNVWLDLNRVVLLRNYVRVEVDFVYIFWILIWFDMILINWILNYFVVVVLIDVCWNGEESIDY